MAKCGDLEFIPVENDIVDGQFEFKGTTKLLNGTLEANADKEFVKVEVINSNVYLVVKKE